MAARRPVRRAGPLLEEVDYDHEPRPYYNQPFDERNGWIVGSVEVRGMRDYLLPCPACGAWVKLEAASSIKGGSFKVRCACGQESVEGGREEVTAQWNRRLERAGECPVCLAVRFEACRDQKGHPRTWHKERWPT